MSEYASSPFVCLRLCGAPSITTPIGAISPAKPFVFAAALYLGLNRGRTVRRDELATLLWPDASDAKRGERMRWLVRQLKLSGLALAAGAPEVALAATDVKLDVDALAAAPSAAHVLSLVQADVLAGYDPPISDRFSRWLEEMRDLYRADVLRRLADWLATTRRNQSWQSVEAIARRMLALDEGRADASAALAEALRTHGSRASDDGVSQGTRTTLVGRGAVLARLTEGLTPSSSAGHRLGIAGPSGIGKSRLLDELAQRATARGITVARLRCQRGDALRPLSVAVDLTRALLQLPGALGASPESMSVLSRFVGDGHSADDGQPPDVRRAAVYTAIRDLVGAVTEEAGLAVVVDDAQWAEPGSWALLAPAFAKRSASPLCWAVTIRAETDVEGARVFETIFPCDDAASECERELFWLPPLAPDDISRLCVSLAAPRIIPPSVLPVLTSRAAGVPFIAEALLVHWLELGDISLLPPSVARLVRSRLDRLPSNATELLRAIAILGIDAVPPAVGAVTQLERRALTEAVATLETSGILRTVDGVLSAHALWTEAALSRMPAATLQLLHQYAAEWLEQRIMAEESVEPRHHWVVATHWLDAKDHGKAQRALDYSANVLTANGFVVEAAAMLERAGDLAGVARSALHYYHRATLLWMHEVNALATMAMDRLHARYDLVARALDGERFNPHHEVELLSKIAVGRNAVSTDENDTVRRLLPCALADGAPPSHRLRVIGVLLSYYNRSDLDEATATLMWNAASGIVPTNEQEALEFERASVEYYTRVVDRADLAVAHARRTLAIVMSSHNSNTGDRRGMMLALAIADCYERMGDVHSSLAIRRSVFERAQAQNDRTTTILVLDGLVGTLLELGRPEDVRPLLPTLGRAPTDIALHGARDRGRVIYRVVCALEEGNAPLARAELIVPIEAAEDAEGMSRARILSMYAHLALLENDDPTLRRLLPQLLACFKGGAKFVDHPALVTALALERFKGWDAAAAFVRHFVLVHRDERWTPRAELRRFLESGAGEGRITSYAQCDTTMPASV
jgi:DNA-binding SARP family transcriptional activator